MTTKKTKAEKNHFTPFGIAVFEAMEKVSKRNGGKSARGGQIAKALGEPLMVVDALKYLVRVGYVNTGRAIRRAGK